MCETNVQNLPVGILNVQAVSAHHVALELRDMETDEVLLVEIGVPPGARDFFQRWAARSHVLRLDDHYHRSEHCVGPQESDMADQINEALPEE